jgi:hypothetical protein
MKKEKAKEIIKGINRILLSLPNTTKGETGKIRLDLANARFRVFHLCNKK